MRQVILISLALLGCKEDTPQEQQRKIELTTAYDMECVRVATFLDRCENKEAICYYHYSMGNSGAISCNFKAKGLGPSNMIMETK